SAAPDVGETLTVVGVTQGTHGTVTFTPAGVLYTPDADYYGTDTFTCTIADGNGGTAPADVFMVIFPINDGPVAANDAYTTVEDTELTAGSVLDNDTDIDSADLTATLIDGPAHGVLILGVNGVFTYQP